MLAIKIISGLLILVTFIVALFNDKDKNQFHAAYVWITVILSMIFSSLLMSDISEKDTAIQTFKGHNPYKMKIIYELKDSTYIPVDTIYVKIK